jgi:hypothetical protein
LGHNCVGTLDVPAHTTASAGQHMLELLATPLVESVPAAHAESRQQLAVLVSSGGFVQKQVRWNRVPDQPQNRVSLGLSQGLPPAC